MAHFTSVARDSLGNALASPTITVYDAGGLVIRSIFSDAELLVAKGNPFTGSLDGTYDFFTAHGRIKVKVEKAGFDDAVTDDISAIGLFQGLNLPAGAFIQHTGATEANIGDWVSWSFADAATQSVAAMIRGPERWPSGSVVSVGLSYSNPNQTALSWRARVRLISTSDADPTGGLSKTVAEREETLLLVVLGGGDSSPQFSTLVLDIPEVYAPGDTLALQVARIGAHGEDTATHPILFYGALVSLSPD